MEMNHRLFFALAFVTSAAIGFSYVFRTDRVRDAMIRICHQQPFLGFLMGQWLDESPNCVPALRLMGVCGLAVAGLAFFALINRLVNRIP
jgi:hypothetical protein